MKPGIQIENSRPVMSNRNMLATRIVLNVLAATLLKVKINVNI